MKKFAAILLFSFGCGPTAYYVANVYQNGPDLYTQRCAIDNGRNSDKPDPANCRFERVGPVPPELANQIPAGPPPSPAPPPAPPMQ